MGSLFLLGALGPAVAADQVAHVERTDDAAELRALIDEMERAAAGVTDATYTFHKTEYVGGQLLPSEQIAVKFRAPNDVYMKWVGQVDTHQELLFRPGWNDDRLRVSPGPLIPTINLDTDSRVVARTNRKTVYNLPFPWIVQNFVRDGELLASDPALAAATTVQDLGTRMVFGEPARCYAMELPKDRAPDLYAARVELCVHERTLLPARVQAWDVEDGTLKLVEDYGYEGMQLNVGLSDADFDPKHSEYHF